MKRPPDLCRGAEKKIVKSMAMGGGFEKETPKKKEGGISGVDQDGAHKTIKKKGRGGPSPINGQDSENKRN